MNPEKWINRLASLPAFTLTMTMGGAGSPALLYVSFYQRFPEKFISGFF
jgi:hypothetical protein